MTIGQRIKDARKQAHITQAELAQKLNVPFQSVSQWERDIRNPKLQTIQRIAHALGVSPTYLIGYDEKIVKPEQYTPEELAEIKAAAWTAYEDHILAVAEHPLLAAFRKLNEDGQQKAIERVEELTEIPKYKKIPDATNIQD